MKIMITGGASGLGKAMTEHLAAQPGWQICFSYHQSEASAKDIAARFPGTDYRYCDFRNEQSVQNLCDHLQSWNPDVLIHNAYCGSYLGTHFHKTPIDAFTNDFQTNLVPVIKLTQVALELFRKRKQGKLITVLTAALNEPPAIGASVYVAGKAYLQALAKSWATENEKFNIRSVMVLPGFMETKLTATLDERFVDQLRAKQKTGRFLQVEDVAQVILELCQSTTLANGAIIELHPGTEPYRT